MSSSLITLPLAGFGGHMDWNGDWSIVMILGMVLFWALIVACIVWVVRELAAGRRAQAPATGDDPLAILERRLADGSISPDDYRDRRAMLADGDGGPDH